MSNVADLATITDVSGALALTTGQTAELPAVITQASVAIERFCDRKLASRDYDEVYEPGRTRTVRLRQIPVSAIARLTCSPWGVANITYVGTDASRASVAMTTTAGVTPPFSSADVTGISLFTMKSGTSNTVPLLFATYTTLTSLAAAVNAVSGWQMTIATGYENWATADLNMELGARAALGAQIPLWAFIQEITDYNFDNPERGVITIGGGWPFTGLPLLGWVPDTFRYPDRTWGANKRFGQMRAQYTAGYSTSSPEWPLLNRACISVVQSIFANESLTSLIKVQRTSMATLELAPKVDDIVAMTCGGMLRPFRRVAV